MSAQIASEPRQRIQTLLRPRWSESKTPNPAVEALIETDITRIIPVDWDACFSGELEGHSYLLAVQKAGIEGFTLKYVVLREGGRVIAAMPAFHTIYSLATTLDPGFLKAKIEGIQKRSPGFMRLKLGCLGSPETECGLAGFHPSVLDSRKPVLLKALVTAFEQDARQSRCELLAVKDAPCDDPLWTGITKTFRYTRMPGMATAHLDIDFKTLDEYLARFSASARRDMRRKLRSRSALRVEMRSNIDGVLNEVFALYLDTKSRADNHLNDLTPEYFSGVLSEMPDRSLVMLYYAEDRLLAANILLKDKNKLLDKFFVMNGAQGRRYNLYFVSWFENIKYCIENGIPHYQSGQACYETKAKMRSYRKNNNLLFKHVNPAMNWVFRAASPLFALDNTEVSS